MNFSSNLPSLLVRPAARMGELGEMLSAHIIPGDILLLEGELGAGKTTLAQGIARGLGSPTPVTSPTFVLQIEHQTPLSPLLHLDAYRLEGADFEAGREAGLDDFFARRDCIRLVEWPSMIADWIEIYGEPDLTWRIRIEHLEHPRDARQIGISAPVGRGQVLGEALDWLAKAWQGAQGTQ